MFVVRKDETAKGVPAFVVELHKRSYLPRGSSDRERVMDDESAMDVIRYRTDEGELLAIAREIIKHLPFEKIDQLVEKRLYTLWESQGLAIPWGCRVEISNNSHRLIRPEKLP